MRSLLLFATSQLWALERGTADSLAVILNRKLAGESLTAEERQKAIGRADGDDHPDTMAYQVRDGVALVPVRGVIAKYSSDVGGVSQPEGTSAEKIQAQMRAALADPAVRSIVLAIDSPGGQVSGTPDTAALIRAVAQVKPVIAHIEDMGASAGYWLASAASQVYANGNAIVGSIGVITRMVDTSEMAKNAGAKVTVIRSASLKAPGQPGEAITDAQVAEVQRMVADMHGMFTAAVQAGRDFTDAQLAAVSTGQVWVAADAMNLGLIDGITSLDGLVSQLAGKSINTLNIQGISAMKITADTLASLIEAHPGQAKVIAEAARADKDEPTILGLVAEAKGMQAVTALRAEVAALTAAGAAAASKIADLEGKLATAAAAVTDKDARLKSVAKLESSTPATVGGASDKAFDGLTGETLWKAQYAASAELRNDFYSEGAYLGFKRNEAKITGKAGDA